MPDKLRAWCRANWNKIDQENREIILDHIDKWFNPETKEADIAWLQNYDNEPFFHLTQGMALRNRIRQQYGDNALPVVDTDHEGRPYGPSQNWDDYYTGALDEYLERQKK